MVGYHGSMQTTTTGRSPLATLALRIGETVTIRTTDGWNAVVLLTDVRSSYGALQVKVTQMARTNSVSPWTGQIDPTRNGRWIDASRAGLI